MIVIPDDQPVVMGASPAFADFLTRHAVVRFDTLPGGESALVERIRDAEIVVNIRSSCKFTGSVLEQCRRLKHLSIWGTGTDNVDLAAAERLGITVTNTPNVSAVSIAEHSLSLMLAVARRTVVVDRQTRQGLWPRGQMKQLSGKTLGVIGLGAIGSRMARLGEGIGMRVVAWTMHPESKQGFRLVSLEDLLAESDVVSVHLRLSEQTRGFLNRERLSRMKDGAILINTARGPIVEEAALLEALREGRLSGAGLDVFDTEPLPAGHEFNAMEQVVLSPHNAGVTPEALEAGLSLALKNVESFLAGHPVNRVAPL